MPVLPPDDRPVAQVGLRVTTASWTDVVAVVELCGPEALAARFLGAGAPPRAEVLGRLARTLHEGRTLVASVGRPVGLLGVHPDGEQRAELCALVADAYQARGVGTALLAAELGSSRHRDRTLHALVAHGNLAAHGLVRSAARRVPVTRHRATDGVEYVLHPRGPA
ncbi:GNAT family N-acetyltransferase [Pseudonocardia sp. RS010]|uniref:GNAT family N-acetyltransferase n=1 Tax=Pseudonocardia sp. RS010 TaxID=3385979 RepID=UPI0039A02634